MISDSIREKALALASEIMDAEEYRDMRAKEEILKGDSEAQSLLADFQQKQQDFITKRMRGEVDQELIGEITKIQSELEKRESVVNFIDSYGKFINFLGEVGDVISRELNFDFGEVYRK
ncbi:MAG TPA: YlbF family regulator [Archaeoglobaceae archaeon]|nr:YlbF family regulator [Archaeoglobaceae archaeon]